MWIYGIPYIRVLSIIKKMKTTKIVIFLAILLNQLGQVAYCQKQNNMNIHYKLMVVNDFSTVANFEINKKDLDRNIAYQKKKYGIDKTYKIDIKSEFSKWNSVNSVDSILYIYIPPKPNTPRRLQIINDVVITYFHDGMYSQIIKEFQKVNDTTYKFKLCHNHESPHEDGYIPATLTIINEEEGIAVWEEWRKLDEPLVFYYVKHEQSTNIAHVKNKENINGDLEYSFDNELLKEMKKNR